jgi:NAD(P)-dependent dehydrogenase (short-subunit alcohol dehydrogenase family)
MTAPVVIIGATGGIGHALTTRLTAAGIPVFAIGRSAEKLANLGVPYAVADATNTEALDAAIKSAGAELSGLVYAVGSIVLKSIKTAKPEDYATAFQLNLIGAAMALKSATPALVAGNGSVVLFSTIAVAQGFSNHVVISAAKGAVEGFARAAAADLAPKVRVNCIAPSLTRTPLAHALTSNETTAQGIAKMHPIERLGEADDSAALAAFLLSPDSGWITGQIIGVDGGRSRLRTKG